VAGGQPCLRSFPPKGPTSRSETSLAGGVKTVPPNWGQAQKATPNCHTTASLFKGCGETPPSWPPQSPPWPPGVISIPSRPMPTQLNAGIALGVETSLPQKLSRTRAMPGPGPSTAFPPPLSRTCHKLFCFFPFGIKKGMNRAARRFCLDPFSPQTGLARGRLPKNSNSPGCFSPDPEKQGPAGPFPFPPPGP